MDGVRDGNQKRINELALELRHRTESARVSDEDDQILEHDSHSDFA